MSEPSCPGCHSPMRPRKWGRTHSGSQRLRCPACLAVYNAAPRRHGYPDALRQQAVRMYVDGLNLRRVARLLGVNHQSVANWVRAYQVRLLERHPAPPQPERAETVELDELYTFVGSKKAASTSAPP